jgi:DNA-binding MarR family transcriptional regulator
MADRKDSVDRMLEGWARVRPDLDVEPAAVVARLRRVRDFQDYELEALFAEHGLSSTVFAVLVTLKRLEEPGGVAAGALRDAWSRAPSTLELRLDRLVDQGLVERDGGRYALSPAGHRIFERAAPAHLANAGRLLEPLDPGERHQLAGLLRKLLAAYEADARD